MNLPTAITTKTTPPLQQHLYTTHTHDSTTTNLFAIVFVIVGCSNGITEAIFFPCEYPCILTVATSYIVYFSLL